MLLFFLIQPFVLSKLSSGLSCDIMWLSVLLYVCSSAARVYQSIVWAQREAQSQTMVHPPLLHQMHSLHNSEKKKNQTSASIAIRKHVVLFFSQHVREVIMCLHVPRYVQCCFFSSSISVILWLYDTLCSNLHDSLLPTLNKFRLCWQPAGSVRTKSKNKKAPWPVFRRGPFLKQHIALHRRMKGKMQSRLSIGPAQNGSWLSLDCRVSLCVCQSGSLSIWAAAPISFTAWCCVLQDSAACVPIFVCVCVEWSSDTKICLISSRDARWSWS